MSTTTLRPNGTISNTGTLVGAASVHAALSDDDDNSYLDLVKDVPEDAFEVSFADYSPVAGSVVSRLNFGIRRRHSGGSTVSTEWLATLGGKQLDGVLNFSYGGGVFGTLNFGYAWETFSDAELDAATFYLARDNSVISSVRISELYLDVQYVEQPDLTVDAPTGTVRDTNQPEVRWTPDLDSDGGSQTHFEVKIFDDATYGGGGFDPDTSSPITESGEVASSSTSYQVEDTLAGTFRAYVRIAQTVNGAQHWSDWEYAEFVVDAGSPNSPGLTLTAQDGSGRIQIDLDDADSGETTDRFEVQWSHDGGSTWTAVRTGDGNGEVDADGSGNATIWDYEAPNGETVNYRARAAKDWGTGFSWSDWTEESVSWSSGDRWLKHPTNPNLNMKVEIHSYASHQRAARQQVFQPLGRTDPVVVSDTRRPKTGEIVLWLEDEEDREDLNVLLDTLDPLLLQPAAGDRRPDRWMVFGDVAEESAVDKLAVSDTRNRLTWTEVARPGV